MGPGAGVHGGQVVAEGTPADIMATPQSLTGQYLTGVRRIEVPAVRRPGNGRAITVRNAREHNLHNVDATFPLGTPTCITGVTGGGKSPLAIETPDRQACGLGRTDSVREALGRNGINKKKQTNQ